MFKDIKNTMSLKRSNSYSDIAGNATLQCLASGINYPIGDAEFVIGRSLACSLVIEEKAISRRHCFINKCNGQYVISDNGTGNGTYINCVQIPNNQNDYQVLNHGDVISFADGSGNYKYLYRFVFQTYADKKLKRNNELYDKENESSKTQSQILNKNLAMKNVLTKIQSDVDNLKIEKALLKHCITAKLYEFNEIINQASKAVKKLNEEVLKHKLTINELTKKNLDYQSTLKIQQDQGSIIEETIKEKVYSVLENDFQCPICNELMVKACAINCSHTFCEICLNTWLKKSKVCPVCRTSVQTKTLCLSLDNFITNICDLLGNAIKEQREKVQQERLTVNVPQVDQAPPAPTARRGGRGRGRTQRRNTQPTHVHQEIMQRIHEVFPHFEIDLSNFMPIEVPRRRTPRTNEPIEVVDLTHNMSR
ncbi:E3 ubiquitin-protein ligase CHFR-like [Daktulosphaira vitifoliae]|uniref:E3 ubiquitin-protein ligase CHFR-like n=1 Tax=Daktulosphaira vitifoliae TaxID=58002 RepID=UPI0021AADC68|nr:E3 ubiquitin-protein ligase CHFR-like [Daktulosphaira vitifoliae]